MRHGLKTCVSYAVFIHYSGRTMPVKDKISFAVELKMKFVLSVIVKAGVSQQNGSVLVFMF